MSEQNPFMMSASKRSFSAFFDEMDSQPDTTMTQPGTPKFGNKEIAREEKSPADLDEPTTKRTRAQVSMERNEKIAPPIRIRTPRITPRDDINKVGSDGKPLSLIIGTLKGHPTIDVFTKKKKTDASTGTIALHCFLDTLDLRGIGRKKNSFSIRDIDIDSKYEAGDLEKTKLRLISALSADQVPRARDKALKKSDAHENSESDSDEDEEDWLEQRHRTRSSDLRSSRSFYFRQPIIPGKFKSASTSPNEVAFDLFKQSLEIVEGPLKQRIMELEKENKKYREARNLDYKEIISLKERIAELDAQIASTNSIPQVHAPGERILQQVSQAPVKIEPSAQSSSGAPKYRNVEGMVYEVLGGENAGFLKGEDGKLHIRDGAACKEYTILREDKVFHFPGASKDEITQTDTGVYRDVIISRSDGGFTKQSILQEPAEVVREGGKEYTAFNAMKFSYM